MSASFQRKYLPKSLRYLVSYGIVVCLRESMYKITEWVLYIECFRKAHQETEIWSLLVIPAVCEK